MGGDACAHLSIITTSKQGFLIPLLEQLSTTAMLIQTVYLTMVGRTPTNPPQSTEYLDVHNVMVAHPCALLLSLKNIISEPHKINKSLAANGMLSNY